MIYKVSKYVWVPLLALATFGAYDIWYKIYDAMWDVHASAVVFTGIMFAGGVADWWVRWVEYENNG